MICPDASERYWIEEVAADSGSWWAAVEVRSERWWRRRRRRSCCGQVCKLFTGMSRRVVFKRAGGAMFGGG